MDDIAVGRLIMLARQRKGWRQKDLAAAAGVSQQLVAIAESGALERLTVRALRKVAAPVEIRMPSDRYGTAVKLIGCGTATTHRLSSR